MGEFNNAGFPLSYCLLSTATAIDQRKRTKALAAWAQCVHDKYSLNSVFIHTDKDMAEIGCSRMVWDAKINLCWWHLRRAVRARLAKGKLSTSEDNSSTGSNVRERFAEPANDPRSCVHPSQALCSGSRTQCSGLTLTCRTPPLVLVASSSAMVWTPFNKTYCYMVSPYYSIQQLVDYCLYKLDINKISTD